MISFYVDPEAKSRIVTIQIVFFKNLSGHWVPSGFEEGENEGRKPTGEAIAGVQTSRGGDWGQDCGHGDGMC